MNITKQNNALGLILILLSFLSFAVSNTATSFITRISSIPIPIYFGYVKFFAVIIMLTLGLIIFGKNFFYVTNKKMVFVRCLILVINNICLTLSLSYLQLDIFYSIVFIMPLMTSLMGVFILKERFTWLNLLAIVIGFIGILIVVQPNVKNELGYLGVICSIVTAITGSLSAIIARKYLQNENPYSVTLYATISSFILGVLMLASQGNLATFSSINEYIDLKVSIIIFFSALFTIIASSLFMKAYQMAKATIIAPAQYTQLLWGILFGFVFFGEKTTFTTLLGCAIIVFATFFNFYVSKEKKNGVS